MKQREWLPPERPELWAAYRERGRVEDRNALVMHYAPIARAVVGARARRIVHEGVFSREDVEQDLMIVLQELVEAFDPVQYPGVPFAKFALMLLTRRWASAVRNYDEIDRRLRARGEYPASSGSAGPWTTPPSWPTRCSARRRSAPAAGRRSGLPPGAAAAPAPQGRPVRRAAVLARLAPPADRGLLPMRPLGREPAAEAGAAAAAGGDWAGRLDRPAGDPH